MARTQFNTSVEETQAPLYRVSTAATAVIQETRLNPVIPTFHKAALHAQQNHQKKQTQRPSRKRLTSRLKQRFALATVVLVGGFTLRWVEATREPVWPKTESVKSFFADNSHNAMQGPNAAHFYASAADALHIESASDLTGQGKAEPLSLAQQKEAVTKNALALKLLREGFDYKFQGKNTYSIKAGMETGLSSPVNNYMAQRSLARLLATEAYLKSLEGSTAEAVGSGLDILQFGSDLGHGSRLIDAMVGNMIQSLGTTTALAYAETLTPEEASNALARLDTLPAAPTYTELLQQSKRMDMADLNELFNDNLKGSQLISSANLPYAATLWWHGKQRIVDEVANNYDQYLSRASLTLEQEKQLPRIVPPTNPFSGLLSCDFSSIREGLEKTAAQRAELRAKLQEVSLRRR